MMTVKMGSKIVKVGDVFGRLTVAGEPFRIKGRYHVVILCDCGVASTVRTSNLSSSATNSCGCLAAEMTSRRTTTHGYHRGEDKGRLYSVWHSMISRCYDTSNGSYLNYGGRGIQVCEGWKDNPSAFIEWAKSNGYAQGLQIDRIDNDRGYSPGNCQFVTAAENNRNKRNSVKLTAFGETKCLREWSRDSRCVVSRTTLRKRDELGWHTEAAMETPCRPCQKQVVE
jgi:hypothetical protein